MRCWAVRAKVPPITRQHVAGLIVAELIVAELIAAGSTLRLPGWSSVTSARSVSTFAGSRVVSGFSRN
jgi:hypothetical protein